MPFRFDPRGCQGVEDVSERDLDAATVLHGGQLERPIVVLALALRGVLQIGMKVAARHAAESRRLAIPPAWHDVTTFVEHDLPPTLGSGSEIPCFQLVMRGMRL